MTAEKPQRRTKTARELAEKFGVSERTIRSLMAEPREEFLNRAQQRRIQAGKLRAQGMQYKDIAEEMGLSIGAVGRLVRDARLKGEVPELEQVVKPRTPS